MRDHVEQLFARYRTRGVLIDANLLLLLVVGLLDPRQITSFGRTNAYEPNDFELLARVVEHFEAVVTTPHVLTETSNFLGQLPGQQAAQGRAVLAQLIPDLQEESRSASALAERSPFQPFGLTDTGIDERASEAHLVLTDDLPLYHYLAGQGRDAINFNHLRMASW
jgi:hypothetical protein